MSSSSNLKDKSTIINDEFWLDDPAILISSDRLTEFFPHKLFTLNEKLNSLVRLAMYISIILIFYFKNIKWSNIFLFSLLLTYYIHINKPTKSEKFIETFGSVTRDSQPADFSTPSILSESTTPTQDSVLYSQDQSECTQPTLDNPFMNMTMKDYLNFDKSGKIKERPP
ncbi:MAG: hypothetical protein EBX50_16560, partial [Chitinophagia bacterium]|nr:hypothetical protein [Chitinophagia bacterium]